MPENVVRLSVD